MSKSLEQEKQTFINRDLTGYQYIIVYIIAVTMAFFQIAVMTFPVLDAWLIRATHLGFASVLVFLLYPATKRSLRGRFTIIDVVLVLLTIAVTIYIFSEYETIIYRMGTAPILTDVIFGGIALILLFEMTRRVTGIILPIIAFVFLGYAFLGPYLPGILWHNGYSLERTISFLFSTDGIYTTPLGVSSTYIFLFIIFGAFMNASGVGQYFIDLAYSIAGRMRGGPAKVSVVASTLFGSISGSSVTNVASTGVLTIPLMKKVGYSSRFAASVESVASTGGQITPPILGSAIFLMLEILSVPYTELIAAALIPCFLYYLTVFFIVDREALKLGLKGLPKEELPNIKKLVRKFYLLLPIMILLAFIVVLRSSPILAALVAILSCIVVSWLTTDFKLGIKRILNTLYTGTKGAFNVIAACAIAGVIVGIISLTGLGIRIASIVIEISNGIPFIALILTMVVCIILGMGMPTVAAYAITASVIAPPLIQMGLPALPVHFFIFYFSCLSAITPPVALASYTAAGIAKTDPLKVSWSTLKMGLTAFIIPFMFVYGPSLLFQGDGLEIFISVVTASFGVIALGGALQKYFFTETLWWEQILLFISAFLLVETSTFTDIIGIVIFILIAFKQVMIRRKKLLVNS